MADGRGCCHVVRCVPRMMPSAGARIALAPQLLLLLLLGLLHTPQAAQPRIAVSDFLDVASPKAISSFARCNGLLGRLRPPRDCVPLPWLGAGPPSVRELRHSVLNMRVIYNVSARVCAGHPSFVGAGLAPPDYCLNPSPRCNMLHPSDQIDEYNNERVFLARHLQTASTVCDPGAGPGACEADIIVVPSLIMHFFVLRGFTWAYHDCIPQEAHLAFFAEVRRLYFDGREPPPLIVMHSEAPHGAGSTGALITALGQQPHNFVSAMVVGHRLSRLMRRHRHLFAAEWSDDAMVELPRREALVGGGGALSGTAAGGGGGTAAPVGLDWGGPLLISVPSGTGFVRAPMLWPPSPASGRSAISSSRAAKRPRASKRQDEHHQRDIFILAAASVKRGGHRDEHGRQNQYVRRHILEGMRRLNANCTKTLSMCAECAKLKRQRGACPLLTPGGTAAASGAVAARGASPMLSQVLRAHLCFEPPGDTLERSHMYIALLSQCVPILIEGGHRSYDESQHTPWPWRLPPSRPAAERADEPSTSLPPEGSDDGSPTATTDERGRPARRAGWHGLDYSRFAVVLNASAFGSASSRSFGTAWHASVRGLVGSARLAEMRAELRRVAPFFVYALDDASCAEDAAARLRAGWRPPAGMVNVGGEAGGDDNDRAAPAVGLMSASAHRQLPPCDAFDVYRRLLVRAWRVHRLVVTTPTTAGGTRVAAGHGAAVADVAAAGVVTPPTT